MDSVKLTSKATLV